ncbi:MAG: hypothetical protein IJ329_01745 [Clostridia bacterium]|nr:hypothetical protein [Clostridia bacterium]
MNKKVVYIVILIECILAVFLISFFGQAIFSAVNKVPVQYVHFTYADGTVIEDNVALQFELSDSKRDYQVYWEVGPDNATNTAVRFTCDKDESMVIVDETTGVVTFFEDIDVIITISSTDGSNVSDSIHLIPQNKDGGNVEI